MSHTPGPWKAYKDDDPRARNPNLFVGADRYGDIASIGGGLLAVREANARLIAAAPQLLEALQSLVNSPNARQNEMWDQARAAIAAAQQEPSHADR